MPKAVIFDMDGTLIDTVPLHARAWENTFRHFGHEVPDELLRRFDSSPLAARAARP